MLLLTAAESILGTRPCCKLMPLAAARMCVLLCLLASTGCDSSTEPAPLGFGGVRVSSTHREADLGWRSSDGAILSGTLFLPPGVGRYTAIVIHMGSDRWTRLSYPAVAGWLHYGVAVFTYDKRGVGRSQGECCPYNDPGYFPLLASDVVTAVRQLREYPEIRPDRVGGWGFSQGGWVIPVAAVQAAGDIAFAWIGSGPAVSVGEEVLYSALTGEAQCHETGLDPAEIERRLDAAGPSGFDPRPWLEQMAVPGLWIYGGLDLSIPVQRSVLHLTDVKTAFSRDFTTVVVPGINHSWIVGGGICQRSGTVWVDEPVTVPWLDARFPGWRTR